MPQPSLSRRQVREVDRRAIDEYGMPGVALMENAGRGLADQLVDLRIRGPVAICCGKGNNGGDGFVLARHLDLRGVEVRVLLFADPAELEGDARINYRVLRQSGVPIEVFSDVEPGRLQRLLADADWIVDALLGTGAKGEPRPPLDAVIDAINAHPARKLAVDLPSGLDCDSGVAAGHTVRATHTCTFVAAKPGFFAAGAADFVGTLSVIDIGAPRKLIEELLSETTAQG